MSMVDPSIDYLAENADTLLAAKRARELTVGNQNMPQKEVSTALREIADDVITYERKVR